jgi:hypothetical protein
MHYGLHLTSAGGNSVEETLDAGSMADAIAEAEHRHPGYLVVRGRSLDHYTPDGPRADLAREAFQAGLTQ